MAKDGLDQWIYFLENEQLPEPCSAKGLGAAKEKLAIMRFSATERQAYERYQKHLHIQASEMEFSIKRAEKAESELARTQTMLLGEKERVELALRQKEEERRQKEAALEKLEAAVTALVAAGHTREDARKIVGLG